MPSTTRGSILISTANDIGEALVEKLGGVGYSPNDWKNNINLCGIAPVDSAPALSVLSDSAGTGDERGSILIATADAIGAILNKKYNVLRGFKPKEWASACRKMKALESGSVASSSIASFSDGADTVPLTSCVCNIDANLDGKTAVNAVHSGVNLFNKNAISPNTWIIVNSTDTEAANSYSTSDYIPVKANTRYFVSFKDSNRSAYYDKNKNGIAYFSFNGNASFSALYDGYIRITIKNDVDLDTFIVNEGNDQATYEAYKGETKTADLGRAVYGGQADIINGTGTIGYALFTKNTADMNNSESYPGWKDQGVRAICGGGLNQEYEDGVTSAGNGYGINTLGNTNDILYLPKSMHNNMTQTDWVALAIDITFVIPLATPEDFTFEPVKIDSFPGVNNIWNDCGNTAVEYYKAPTPYTRKTATGGIANFSDQRTDLPLTKAIANIAPSIAGKSAVNLYQGKKNLVALNLSPDHATVENGVTINTQTSNTLNMTTTGVAYACERLFYTLRAGTYTARFLATSSDSFAPKVALYKYPSGSVLTSSFASNEAKTFALTEETVVDIRLFASGNADTAIRTVEFTNFQLEVGSSASAYEQYQAPTTYAAELGETVYGGSVDFVSGKVNNEYGMITFDGSSDESWLYSDAYGWFYIDNQFGDAYRNNSESDFMICNLGTQSPYVSVTSLPDLHFACTSGTNSRFAFKNSQYSTVEDFKTWLSNNNMIVVYKLATPTESTIPGRVISPIEGVNNYWNDAGGDTEIQYFEDET